MKKYCPRWVFMTIVAQACFDYIKLGADVGLLVISHKYDNGLKDLYQDVDLPKIDEVAKKFLSTCRELKINQNAEHVISDFLYYKFNYVNSALKRNFDSFLNDWKYSNYPRYPTLEDTVQNFYRFSNSWIKNRKIIYERAWNLLTQNKFEELRLLASKPFSNELLKMNDIKNTEEKLTHIWTKD